MGYLDEIRRRGRDANPYFQLMGIDIIAYDDGKAILGMDVRPDMLNGEGWMQGGIFTALCDEAMALALYTVLEDDNIITTISETTSFLRGVQRGRIIAQGRVIKKGRRVAFAEGDVREAEGNGALLSLSGASFAILKRS
jgi:acyl-CoA thioesterase